MAVGIVQKKFILISKGLGVGRVCLVLFLFPGRSLTLFDEASFILRLLLKIKASVFYGCLDSSYIMS